MHFRYFVQSTKAEREELNVGAQYFARKRALLSYITSEARLKGLIESKITSKATLKEKHSPEKVL
jgi:hypothetical protein